MHIRTEAAAGCQSQFHARFGHLRDPHVRTLAWLLHAPDMLDAGWPGWEGRVLSLTDENPASDAQWLDVLDEDPSDLHAHLKIARHTRLGRYAEQLLAWHFKRAGILHAQGVQVRTGDRTLGEFDFLLEREGRLLHRELATKVYLLRADQLSARHKTDYFVGPNLADTLGAKVSKIIHRQLALSSHEAAADVLPRAVDNVGAWMKGWLFYPGLSMDSFSAPGLSPQHCRGSWFALDDFAAHAGDKRYVLLDRLQWLTPQGCAADALLSGARLQEDVQAAFAAQSTPVMLAEMEEAHAGDGHWIERSRCFVVPNPWPGAAALKT